MKMFTLIIVCMTLVSCASTSNPSQALVLDKEISAMSRNEVIIAVKECEVSRMRAVLVMGKRKIGNHTADVIVDVTCAPLYYY